MHPAPLPEGEGPPPLWLVAPPAPPVGSVVVSTDVEEMCKLNTLHDMYGCLCELMSRALRFHYDASFLLSEKSNVERQCLWESFDEMQGLGHLRLVNHCRKDS